MDAAHLGGITTAVALLAYLGVVGWAYCARNRERFERDALLPFADEADAIADVVVGPAPGGAGDPL